MTASFRERAAAAARRLVRPRLGAALLFGLGMTACSTDDILRPNVDVGQQTAAISRVRVKPLADSRDQFVPDADQRAGTLDAQRDALDPQNTLAADEEISSGMAEPGPDDELVDTAAAEPYLDSSQPSDDGVDLSGEPSESQSLEPDVPIEPPVRVAALPRPSIAPLPPAEPRQSSYPRLEPPVQPRALSSEEADCRRQLKKLGVRYQDLAPIRDSNSCFIDRPVKISAMGSVEMKPAATLTCRMALTFAQWTRKELVPNTRWRYLSGVKTIRQGSSYSCRKIAGSRTQSAHSQGNALDVMAIVLNNGKEIDVRKKGFFSFRERKLLNNVRADGCEYFTTVLGPGYNYDHRNHFHFDLMQRKSGHRACH